MKKILLLIIFCYIMILGLTGCNNSFNDEKTLEKETNNSSEYLRDGYDLICNDIKDNNYYLEYNKIYMQNKIYDLLLYSDELYSNNQKCKSINGINYDRYVILNQSAYGDIFIKDNQAYVFNQINSQEAKLVKYDWVSVYETIALEKDVKSISLESSISENDVTNNNYYILKNDGNVYLYETKYNKIVSKEKIVYNSNDYGIIKYFYYSSNDSKEIENIIIFSENGLYTNKTIEDDNCIKYTDIVCKKQLVLNKEFEKIKNEIVFLNKDYIVDKHNVIYINNFVNIEYIP